MTLSVLFFLFFCLFFGWLVFHGVLMLLFFPFLFNITDSNISTEPSGDLRPGTLGRDSLPASAWNGEDVLSIRVSGCDFCISQQRAEQNRDVNR